MRLFSSALLYLYLNFLKSDNSLFSSGQSSDSEEKKENGTSAVGTKTAPKHTLTGSGGAGVGGLFDDDEDDDFFSGKPLKKSDSGK